MKNDPVQKALAELEQAAPEQLAKALNSRWNVVVAKAAKRAGIELLPRLVDAFDRLLPGAAEKDKGCVALAAIAHAMVQFEHDDAEHFRRGMRHIQMEGSYGPPVDAACELRATCAIGLANTRDTRRLRDLVDLLMDREWQPRAAAARGIAAVGSEAAVLLLRYKIMTGDEHEDVLFECFAGLIELEGAETYPFLREHMGEPAVLALGASRRPDAIALLKSIYEDTFNRQLAACILLSLASSRVPDAVEFVREQARDAPAERAKAARQALELLER